MRLRKRRIFFTLLALALIAYGVKAVLSLRPFYRATPHGTDGCTKLEGIPGPEDMEADPRGGGVWIASAQRRGGQHFRPVSGGIYFYRPGVDSKPVQVNIEGATDLRPHGLGLYASPTGEKRLFAVHHGADGDAVVILRIDESAPLPRLVHVSTVRDPLLVSLNDVAPVAPASFYATNDHGSAAGAGHTLEDFLFLARASVVFYDGAAARTVARGLRYANGVLADPELPRVYVAETTAMRVRVFTRQPDNSLDELARQDVDTAPDNFSRTQGGALLVGSHPSTLAFLRHAGDAARRSPSQVLRLAFDHSGAVTERREIYLDSGDPLSGSSVAVDAGGQLLIGGVFDPFVLRCPAPAAAPAQ